MSPRLQCADCGQLTRSETGLCGRCARARLQHEKPQPSRSTGAGTGQSSGSHLRAAPLEYRLGATVIKVPRPLVAVAIAYLTLVALLCVYVPWERRFRGAAQPLGYSFVWDAPGDVASVDVSRVTLTLIALTAALFAALLVAWYARNRRGSL